MRRPAARVRGGVAARQFWGRSEALVEGCLVARGRVGVLVYGGCRVALRESVLGNLSCCLFAASDVSPAPPT